MGVLEAGVTAVAGVAEAEPDRVLGVEAMSVTSVAGAGSAGVLEAGATAVAGVREAVKVRGGVKRTSSSRLRCLMWARLGSGRGWR